MRLLGALFIACSLLDAAPYAGSAACAECHPAEAALHEASPHADALTPILETNLPELLMERPIRERNGLLYGYEPVAGGLEVVASRGDASTGKSAAAILEWVFGAGSQGRTAVGRSKGRYLEHRVSYYTLPDKLAITLGHPLKPPRSPQAALGQRLSGEQALKCFHCHATGVRFGGDGPDLRQMTPGIQCERCHGRGAEHIAAARQDPARAAEAITARRGDPRETLEFCGQCHRSPAGAQHPNDPLNVRFQPIGLARSRCFTQSDSLTCTSCHDPHESVRRDNLFYTAVCLGCHPSAGAKAEAGCGRKLEQDCLPCHMPRTQPTPYLEFTDHEIGVRGAK